MDKVNKILKEQVSDNLFQKKQTEFKVIKKLAQILLTLLIIKTLKLMKPQIKKIDIMLNLEIKAIKKR